MGYSTLKAALDAVVKTNGRQQITGSNLNGVMTTLLQGVDVLDRANPADTSGMNKVVLKKNKTFAEQVTGTNTIYEIRDNFTLSADFTMPGNSVLLFMGGSIDGAYTLDLNNCQILGTNDWVGTSLILSGKTASPCFVDWFKGTDSDKIERAISIFHNVRLSARKYNISRSIVIGGSFALYGYAIPDDSGDYGGSSGVRDFSQSILDGSSLNGVPILQVVGAGANAAHMASFIVSGVSFEGNERNCTGIEVTTSGGPSRPIVIEKCRFHGLEKGISFDMSITGRTTGVCVVHIKENNIFSCTYGIYCTGDTSLMNCVIDNNNIEQNLSYGIYLVNSSSSVLGPVQSFIEIKNNLLEGQLHPITITCTRANIRLVGNYYEYNQGQTISISAINVMSFVTILDEYGGGTIPVYEISNCGIDAKNLIYQSVHNNLKLTKCWSESNIYGLSDFTYVITPGKIGTLRDGGTPAVRTNFAFDAWDGERFWKKAASGITGQLKNVSLSAGKVTVSVLIKSKDFNLTRCGKVSILGQKLVSGAPVEIYASSIFMTKIQEVFLINAQFNLDDALSGIVYLRINNTSDITPLVSDICWYSGAFNYPILPIYDEASINQPTLTADEAGASYFDRTLGKQIVWNGTAWVNMDGSALA